MSTPNELTGTDGIEPQDIVMVWSRRNRDTRGVSFGELNDSVRAVAVEAVASETDGAVAAVQAAGAAALAPLADSVSQANQFATAASGARTDAIQARDAAAASAAAASDSLAGAVKTSDLTTPSTVAIGGFSAAEAQSILDNALPLQSYTALRAYAGRANGVRITSPGTSGVFLRDLTDTTSADDGGVIIVDASSHRWRRIYSGAADVRWFGAQPGVDSGAAINACAASPNVPSLMIGEGVFLSSVQIVNNGKNIFGSGQAKTILRATAAINDALLKVSGRIILTDMQLDANNLAWHSLKFQNSNGSTGRGLWTLKGKLDGVVFAATGNNSTSVLDTCLIRTTGTTYSTGTVSGTAGQSTVTFTGASDLTTLGLRTDQDYLEIVGDTLGVAYEVNGVTATTVTVYPPLASTFSGSAFKIRQGSCVAILRNGDNSRITVRNTSIQGAPVAGLLDQALYGAISQNNVVEVNGFGRIIGRRDGPGLGVTYDAREDSNYYEASTFKDVLYAYAQGNLIRIGGSGTYTRHVFSGSFSPTEILGQGQPPTSPTAAIGIAFPAVAVPSSNANTLDDYAEGIWTPVDASPAGLVFTAASGTYTKIGRLVIASCTLTYPTTGGANTAYIGGLPIAAANPTTCGAFVANNTSSTPLLIRGYSPSAVQPVTEAGAAVPNSALSAATLRFTTIYNA